LAIWGNGIRWNETKHVELEQFWHAFTSRGFDSVSWAFLYYLLYLLSDLLITCWLSNFSFCLIGQFYQWPQVKWDCQKSFLRYHYWVMFMSVVCIERISTYRWYQWSSLVSVIVAWLSSYVLVSINVVSLRQAWLVLGRLTICVQVSHFSM